MQNINIKNILLQVIKPKRIFVMLKKVKKRLMDDKGLISKEENMQWIKSYCSNFEIIANKFNPTLWREAETFSKMLRERAKKILNEIEYELGGGGAYPFLYFVVRHIQPNCIVETGVAAGFSSYAFLSAIKVNGKGKLHSSDFPYFRIPNPEKYIGIIVDDSLRTDWNLYIDGDETNLPKIINSIDSIDVFHYDSDKSYSGRKYAMSLIEKKLSKNGIILMDDIQDNSYFHDYVVSRQIQAWNIFEFDGKYVGMVGKLRKMV